MRHYIRLPSAPMFASRIEDWYWWTAITPSYINPLIWEELI